MQESSRKIWKEEEKAKKQFHQGQKQMVATRSRSRLRTAANGVLASKKIEAGASAENGNGSVSSRPRASKKSSIQPRINEFDREILLLLLVATAAMALTQGGIVVSFAPYCLIFCMTASYLRLEKANYFTLTKL